MFDEKTSLWCEMEVRNPQPNDEGECGNPVVARWDFQDGSHIYVCEECNNRVELAMEAEYDLAWHFDRAWRILWAMIGGY